LVFLVVNQLAGRAINFSRVHRNALWRFDFAIGFRFLWHKQTFGFQKISVRRFMAGTVLTIAGQLTEARSLRIEPIHARISVFRAFITREYFVPHSRRCPWQKPAFSSGVPNPPWARALRSFTAPKISHCPKLSSTMKLSRLLSLALLPICQLSALDDTVTGNLTVTGTIGAGGIIDSAANEFIFGTQSGSNAVSLLYTDASAPANSNDTLRFNLYRISASWLWSNGTSTLVPAMRLDSNHQLILYQADGTTAGITLTPVTNQLSLGTATLAGNGANLTVGGALTVTSGIINTSGSLTGGASGLTLNAGTAGQPITLSTGGTGDIIFSPGGTERARIKSTGNVGIGTANPSAKIHVLATDTQAIFDRTSSSQYSEFIFSTAGTRNWTLGTRASNSGLHFNYGTTGVNNALYVGTTGLIGVGTTSPSTKLHIYGGSVFNQTAAGLAYYFGGNADGATNAKYSAIGMGSGGHITFNSATDVLAVTEYARFTASGNLGIGTNNPTNSLDIRGTGGRFDGAFVETTTNSGIYLGRVSTPRAMFANGNAAQNWEIDNNNGVFRWFLPGVEHMLLSATTLTLPNKIVVAGASGPPADAIVNAGANNGAYTTAFHGSVVGNSAVGALLDVSNGGNWAQDILVLRRMANGGVVPAVGLGSSLAFTIDAGSAASHAPQISGRISSILTATDGTNNSTALTFETTTLGSMSEKLRITNSGNVGIGTTTPTHKLSVKGTIRAQEIIVDNTNWADYVFEEDYRLAPLAEVEQHIKATKHLPGIPSAAEVAEHGVSMGDMQAKLLSKVEELTLHLIAQEKELAALRSEVAQLKASAKP
jgi:hypothetical protein